MVGKDMNSENVRYEICVLKHHIACSVLHLMMAYSIPFQIWKGMLDNLITVY